MFGVEIFRAKPDIFYKDVVKNIHFSFFLFSLWSRFCYFTDEDLWTDNIYNHVFVPIVLETLNRLDSESPSFFYPATL